MLTNYYLLYFLKVIINLNIKKKSFEGRIGPRQLFPDHNIWYLPKFKQFSQPHQIERWTHRLLKLLKLT